MNVSWSRQWLCCLVGDDGNSGGDSDFTCPVRGNRSCAREAQHRTNRGADCGLSKHVRQWSSTLSTFPCRRPWKNPAAWPFFRESITKCVGEQVVDVPMPKNFQECAEV